MAHGLKPHRHIHYLYDIVRYYDKEHGCMCKKVTYKCYIPNCEHCYSEKYYYQPKAKKHKSKALERQKKKYG
mgnify:FL=1